MTSRSAALKQVNAGYVLVVKESCATCAMLEPVYGELAQGGSAMAVYTQDNPDFPSSVESVIDDRDLEQSFYLDVETVPTLIKVEDGNEVARIVGWNKAQWREFSGLDSLGESQPDFRPGCGARNVEPEMAIELMLKFGGIKLQARPIEIAEMEDEWEACYDRGWSDGLPVVPPTQARVVRMLQGTTRAPDEVVGVIPPDLAECTVEKVAVNAVMAGCKPEYMPVVLAAVEAACIEEFCMHGLLATTWFASPVVIVNGPIAKAIGMNSGGNCLGQGNRANACIGRTLQLVIRNVGGGRPGEVDRSTLGNPGKYTFCFAENEDESPWESLAIERGVEAGVSSVTLFAGDGVQGIIDQQSRTPESLARTFAACLKTVAHPKIAMAADAVLVVSPEHARVFREAGWDKARLQQELQAVSMTPGSEMIRGANDIAEGLPEHFAEVNIPKFRPGGLHIVHAGGKAGMFSAIIGGWVAGGPIGSIAVTKEIVE